VERQAAWIGVALIALAGCRAENTLQRAMRDMPCRPVAGRIDGASYAAPNTRPSDAALKIWLHEFDSKEPDDVRARAALWAGKVRAAKELLERVTSRGNATAAAWSDYSAALYADAAQDDAFQLATALAAADHALDLDPNLPEALFNRALALDAMSLRAAAVDAYKNYLHVDESSPWESEVRSRIERLESSSKNAEKAREALARVANSDDELFINDTAIGFPHESQEWAERQCLVTWGQRVLRSDVAGAASMLERCRIIGRVLETHVGDSFVADSVRAIDRAVDPRDLAKAHVAYGQGNLIPFVSADARLVKFVEARQLFETNGSPMALAARRLQIPLALLTNVERARSTISDLVRQTPERYRALHAQMQLWDAFVASLSGKSDAALKLYRSASTTLGAIDDKRSAASVLELESSLLAADGRTDEAWHLRRATLVAATEANADYTLALTLYGAARDAMAARHWAVAHGLLNAMIPMQYASEELHGNALAWRAFTAQRSGMNRTAAADLRAAQQSERRWGDLALVEALLAKTPEEALMLLNEPLMVAEGHADNRALAQLLVERARLLRATGKPSLAHDDLERAVALLEQTPGRSSRLNIRDAVLGTPDRAYGRLADSLDARGQTEQALNALERSPSFSDHKVLPSRTLVITYGVFDDRLAIYTRNPDGFTRTAVGVTRPRIERLVSTLEQAIARDDRSTFQDTARSLEQILFAPIENLAANADTLVIVRDPAFGNLPFAALSSGNNHFLIHDHNVVVTPSFSAFLRASHTKTTTSRALLSVGNPLSDDRAGGARASLPAAESEAEEIAAMYPSKSLLVEGDATKDRVIGALRLCDAAHFAIHANAGLSDVMPPHLILTKTAKDDGILTAPEIAALHLNGLRTVMLAGCRTALSSQSSDDSLVNAFLTAGAGSVVGTLWEVEDAPTRTMSTLFHRELRNGSTPAQALQKTQLEMIRRNAPPSVWASLQLYGSGR
jgi:CHAT domain-containing protein